MSKQLAEQATTPASHRWRDLIRRKDDGAGEIHRPAQANLRTPAVSRRPSNNCFPQAGGGGEVLSSTSMPTAKARPPRATNGKELEEAIKVAVANYDHNVWSGRA
jgi:hypothetical protein